MFNLKLSAMRKISHYLIVLAAIIFIASSASGQKSTKDSVKLKTDINLSEEVVKKLTNQEIVDIIKYKEELINERKLAAVKDDQPPVPILIVIFGSFVLMMFIPFYFSMRRTKSLHMMMNSLIEKGHDIPKELLFPVRRRSVRSDQHKGIILLALGVSLCIVLYFTKIENVQNNSWTIGFIPLLIGVGYMISHKLNNNSGNSKTEDK